MIGMKSCCPRHETDVTLRPRDGTWITSFYYDKRIILTSSYIGDNNVAETGAPHELRSIDPSSVPMAEPRAAAATKPLPFSVAGCAK
jgi:hypothetical protein